SWVITAWRMGWTKPASHCEPNPAPPAPTSLVSHLLFCRSSAIVILPGYSSATLPLIHWSRFQPSGKSWPPGPGKEWKEGGGGGGGEGGGWCVWDLNNSD